MTIRILRGALGVAQALASAQAAALGLGQIEVRSKLNEPLLAEIPVIYTDPAELEQLQARLASPETFARVGLEPPRGTVADLQFAVALDARGRTVIRVTSLQPVNTSLLIFLVEVDSGQSRVVREYSALVDAPRNAPVAVGPVIEAPVVALPDTVARPVQNVPVPPPQPAPLAAQPAQPVAAQPAAPPSPNAIPATPPRPVAVAPVAPPRPVAVAPAPLPAVAVSSPASKEYGPVKQGETLSQIARQLDPGTGYSLDQTMLALLRANPDAFIGDNINQILRGAVLRVPPPTEMSGISADQAAVLVRGQMDRWRDARRPAPQPVSVASSSASTTPVAAQAAVPPARRVADARLEIVPSAGSRGTQAGTRSGASAGGEGEMLRQELQQSKEDLAARDAEVVELQARIAELEKLQQQQGQLITLKDSELAAAQQRLAESNRTAASPAATLASTTQPGQPAPANSERDTTWLWPLGIVVLAVAGLLGWWFSRRRRAVAEPARRTFSTESLAASMPSPAPSGPGIEPVPAAAAKTKTAGARASNPARAAKPAPALAPAPVRDAPVPEWTAAGAAAPTWHAGNASEAPSLGSTPPASKPALGQESIELARAYIDLGDDDTARSLLREVIDIGDADARSAAAKLLREMS
ncbi:MAG: ferrous iron transporter B [Lysobacter sp.]|nr:ferrous iron transporter B [Lysobacter sp.]